jgi:hypothetical protein
MEGTDSIESSAKWKEWVVIKRTTIREDTKPEEIVFSLASIRQTIDRKAFDLLGIQTAGMDEYATKVTTGMKKNFKDLAQTVQLLSSTEAKATIESACAAKPELQEVAKTYLFRKVIQALGFDFDVNQEMLSKVYPNLKLPKPRGRQPKK